MPCALSFRFSHWRNETLPPAMQAMQTRFSRLAHEGYDRYNGKRYFILKQVHVCRVFIYMLVYSSSFSVI